MNSWRRFHAAWQNVAKHVPFKFRASSVKGFLPLFLLGAFLSLAVAACSFGDRSGEALAPSVRASQVVANSKDIEVTLVSFAVTRSAHEAIIPKFVEKWKQEKNQNVSFKRAYGGSGSQTRAVIDGLDADVVHLALALDTQRIQKAGLIEPGWEKEFPNNGIVSKSVAALVTRPGNPKNIKTWADLSREGIKVITADPKTSGVARWNFLSLWNSVIKTGGDEKKALDFVTTIYTKNVPILARDAREASDAFFKQRQGDVLINYENEVILAKQKGEQVNYTVPDVNISIDNPIAIVDKNVDRHGNREVVEAFTKFLFTPEAQQEFAKVGFRPTNETVAQTKEIKDKYPTVKTLGTVENFGGWSQVQKKFFEDGAIFDQIQSQTR
ncbi:sulfate-binding protein [Dulcicalothrix desertica PCC 7102]|uniref:Sulfate-binding protein n=1 Tax=Dulcicalothrix desertica PCC 7102 TaxID=232991 RepID=A0A3S1AS28_9CYAN|nr:sulfate ABC transporter substrate-binding protein [Dulcicalothrix desertica]RUT07747.1 sulfate-binding protein [Dulcicalothrix desertica PCC 7102]TWH39280.1 sulfate transport system substrate-binding protein [Dulcicalothrix desertica PCC 7102]